MPILPAQEYEVDTRTGMRRLVAEHPTYYFKHRQFYFDYEKKMQVDDPDYHPTIVVQDWKFMDENGTPMDEAALRADPKTRYVCEQVDRLKTQWQGTIPTPQQTTRNCPVCEEAMAESALVDHLVQHARRIAPTGQVPEGRRPGRPRKDADLEA